MTRHTDGNPAEYGGEDVNDDHDAIKAEFDSIVREFAAERVSRATANNVTPPSYEDNPLASARGVGFGCTAVVLAATVVMLVVIALAATSSSPQPTPTNPIPPNVNTAY